MQRRKLGHSHLEVTPLFLGGNVFGWTIDDATSFAVLDAYLEAGGNSIDTADVYSTWVPGHVGGESEAVLGRWFKARGNRDQVILATKVGSRMGSGKEGLSRQHILASVEDSLKRLQTDYIDLYQSHRDDPNMPLEETLQTFDELVRQGKVRAIGASNYTAPRLAEALRVSEQHGYARYESIQPFYNLVERQDYEQALEPLIRAQEVGVIPYSSLASGFLSGKYQPGQVLPQTARAQGVKSKYMNERGFSTLKAVESIAQAHNATPSQVALAWLIARPGITSPIASATSVAQVRELIGAAELTLSAVEIEALNNVGSARI
ncbi:MAG: aldo/keto reductase [Ktedonobacteraceae bacterium]|nr:aldo/keto reductase [Ktedonobacteraceae bacterium]